MVFDLDDEVVGDAEVVRDADAVVIDRLRQILDLQRHDPTRRLVSRLVHLPVRALPDLLQLLGPSQPKKGTRRRSERERDGWASLRRKGREGEAEVGPTCRHRASKRLFTGWPDPMVDEGVTD
jgi:hypothetical protein